MTEHTPGEPVAWRWMNTAFPDRGWELTDKEVKEHPSLLIKVQALYIAPLVANITSEPVSESELRGFIYTRQPVASGELARAILEKYNVSPKPAAVSSPSTEGGNG